MQVGVQLLVRPVIRAADHVGDPEVDVVDDAREVERRRAVVAPEHHALETLRAARPRAPPRGDARRARSAAPGLRPRRCRASARSSTIASSPPGDVPRRVGVVDPQQHPVAEAAVRDRAQRVADVQRPGRAGCEPDAGHGPSLSGGARASRYPGPRALVGCRGGRGHDARAHRRGAGDGAAAGRARGAARGRPRTSGESPRCGKRGGGAAGDHALGEAHSQPARGSRPPARRSVWRQVAALQGKLTTPRATAVIGQLTENDNWFARRGPPPEPDRHRRRRRRRLPVLLGQVLRVPSARELRRTERRRRRREDATPRRSSRLRCAARAVPEPGGGLGWEYYFNFSSGRAPWLSGMAQAVAAQAFAAAAAGDASLIDDGSGRAYRTIASKHLLTAGRGRPVDPPLLLHAARRPERAAADGPLAADLRDAHPGMPTAGALAARMQACRGRDAAALRHRLLERLLARRATRRRSATRST